MFRMIPIFMCKHTHTYSVYSTYTDAPWASFMKYKYNRNLISAEIVKWLHACIQTVQYMHT